MVSTIAIVLVVLTALAVPVGIVVYESAQSELRNRMEEQLIEISRALASLVDAPHVAVTGYLWAGAAPGPGGTPRVTVSWTPKEGAAKESAGAAVSVKARSTDGEVYFDGPYYTADNKNPPVLHVELMNTPVVDPLTGAELDDNVYVYWKNGTERMERPGIQGGGMPVKLGSHASVEPYGHANDEYQAGPKFADYFTASMGMLMKRFEGIRSDFKERRNGGIGAFTPDNIPVVDWILPNVYMIADSNHGFKMTGLGKLVARQLVGSEPVAALRPFAFDRFSRGQAFGSGTTHSPWV